MEGEIDMCQALEELYADGVKEGSADIKRYTGVTDQEIALARDRQL
ncbi:MAG TPA: hypothetical protein H9873_07840 [Candidatus Dorea gallistercoris]|uniref:Uncharacterized protein n=1 Tax=Candidatus Dorea gallistercoris TaxID=2838542 RepID=A0A9D1RCN4_9FIRM|nr:hypothetical protein [Candidatus Dorea gallistercoris]